MQNKTLYIEWFKTMLPSAAIYIAAILLIIFMPVKSYWSILFLGLSLTLGLRLYSDIVSNTKPSWKEYNKTTTATVFFVSLTSLLYSVGGWFGIFGLGLVIMIFAGWRIYQQFDLFDNLTTYISDVLFKGKSYDFDPQKKQEVQENGNGHQFRFEENKRGSVGDVQGRQQDRREDRVIQTEQNGESNGSGFNENTFLQEVQENTVQISEVGFVDALSDVPEILPKMDSETRVVKRRKKKKKKAKKKQEDVV